jgi:hypothetical protein
VELKAVDRVGPESACGPSERTDKSTIRDSVNKTTKNTGNPYLHKNMKGFHGNPLTRELGNIRTKWEPAETFDRLITEHLSLEGTPVQTETSTVP